ncbi:MAG TPA: MFS transporter [Candidatus Binataceae bacterium]|nr:MFS transporter [Candidatus Binataceae bacterium]
MATPESELSAAGELNGEAERKSLHLGLFGRTPPFTPRQWRVFLIAITAGFFDQYDVALLSLALKQIQKSLKIAEEHLGAMLSMIRLGYLLSMAITPLADIFGRRRLLLYTIVGYTIFTGLTAIAPGERSFVIFQVLSRAFAGAETTIALVILIEEIDAQYRGWSVGLLTAISSVGYGIAALVFSMINIVPYGWRGLYALALIPLILIIPLRRVLPESRRFEVESSADRPTNVWQPLAALVRAYPGRLAMLLTISFLSQMGGNAAGEFFPKFLQEVHGYSPANVTTLFFIGGGLGILGNIVAGRLSDRFGRRHVGAVFMLLAPLLTIWIYSAKGFTIAPAWTIELFFDMASGTIMRSFTAELFPTSYRSTAGSAHMVAGTTGGALGFAFESVLYRMTGSHWTAIKYLTVFWMLAPVLIMLLPETAGRELEEISPEVA